VNSINRVSRTSRGRIVPSTFKSRLPLKLPGHIDSNTGRFQVHHVRRQRQIRGPGCLREGAVRLVLEIGKTIAQVAWTWGSTRAR